MNDRFSYYPPQRFGLAFQGILILIFTAAGALSLWQMVYTSIGLLLILYLLASMLALGLIPLLAYRIYALLTAAYSLEREGIHLRWGLRVEDIPIDQILWIHEASEINTPLPLPWLHWPGSLLGSRHVKGVGEVEFLASSTAGLILIGTTARAYAISPSNPPQFLHTASQVMEMGSLAPIVGRSVYPTILMRRVWASRLARLLLICGVFFSLILLIGVALVAPSRSQIFLGFGPDGSVGDAAPASRLLLLPILNTLFFLIDFFLGLFLFRREESQPLSFLLWGVGALLPVLFLLGVLFVVLNSPV